MLALLLSVEFPGVDALRAQAASAVVVGDCGCGCPSVDLELAGDVPLASGFSSRLAPTEGLVRPLGEGVSDEIILFVDNGRLSRLEYVSYDALPPAEWPALDRISVTVRPR